MALYTPAKILQPDGSGLVQLHRNVQLVDGSVVINDPLHDAFICHNGDWYGPLGPGSYPVNTGFGSFLNGLRHFRTGGQLPGVSVFFVRKQTIALPWGTGEVLCQEKILGSLSMQLRVLAGGTALLRVRDSARFLSALVGMRDFDDMDLSDNIAPAILIPGLRGALAKAMADRSAVELQAEQEAITLQLKTSLAARLSPMGLDLVELSVGSLSLHPEDFAKVQQIAAKRIDNAVSLEAERNEVNTLYGGNIRNRIAAQATVAMAHNPGLAGNPMSQLAMMPTVFSGSMQGLVEETMEQADLFAPRPRTPRLCPACDRTIDGSCAFCPRCGAAQS